MRNEEGHSATISREKIAEKKGSLIFQHGLISEKDLLLRVNRWLLSEKMLSVSRPMWARGVRPIAVEEHDCEYDGHTWYYRQDRWAYYANYIAKRQVLIAYDYPGWHSKRRHSHADFQLLISENSRRMIDHPLFD